MSDNELQDADDYVTFDSTTGTLSVDHTQMLADLTGTEPEDWDEAEGPDSGVGTNHYYVSIDETMNARIGNDEGYLDIVIRDADGDDVANDSIDLNDSKTWAMNSDDSDDRDNDDSDDED